MGGEVVGGFPFDAADIRSCGNRGAVAGKVGRGVANRWLGGFWRVGDNVEVVEEDPEDFFSDVNDLFAPDAVRARVVH